VITGATAILPFAVAPNAIIALFFRTGTFQAQELKPPSSTYSLFGEVYALTWCGIPVHSTRMRTIIETPTFQKKPRSFGLRMNALNSLNGSQLTQQPGMSFPAPTERERSAGLVAIRENVVVFASSIST